MKEFLQKQLDSLKERSQYRNLKAISSDAEGNACYNDRKMMNLSSNDYLGLANDRQLQEEFFAGIIDAPSCYGLAAASSRLLTGSHSQYEKLEKLLSDIYGGREALVFNSGYHANIGILSAISGKGDLILSDKLNHASIIDGAGLSDAKLKRYRHGDYQHLEDMLVKNTGRYRNIFIITESIFSMDGDIADLRRLVELKNKYNAVLIVDEAHAFGLFGDTGCGISQQQGVMADVDIIICTFGKSLCSIGACAIMDSVTKDFLINKTRSFIFTTALPPINVSWSHFMLQKIVPMSDRRKHLQSIAAKLRQGIIEKGMVTAGDSQVVPLIVGENQAAVDMADKLQEAGLLVFAIRPPTVPFNTARLRFSLTAALTEADIDKVIAAI